MFFFISCSYFSVSQKTKIDSLRLFVNTAKHDTSLITSLTNLGSYLSKQNNVDSALLILFKAKEVAEKNIDTIDLENSEINKSLRNVFLKKYGSTLLILGRVYKEQKDKKKCMDLYNRALNAFLDGQYTKGAAKTCLEIGLALSQFGETDEAIKWLNKSLKFSEANADKKDIISSLNSLGNAYFDIGNMNESIKAYEKGLKLSEELNDPGIIAKSLINIATVYEQQGQKPYALKYDERALKILLGLNNKLGVAVCYNNIGGIYGSLKNYEKALDYFQKSLRIREENGDKDKMVIALKNLADVYIEQGKYKEAETYLLRALKISEETGKKRSLNLSYAGLGTNFLKQNKLGEATMYLNRSLITSKELGYPGDIENASGLLTEIYKKQGNYKKALEMHELCITMRDSIQNEDNRKASYKSQLKYEYDKKALTDSIKASDEKKLTNAKLAESSAKLKQERTQRFALYGGLALILIFTGFIFNRFKNSQRQKRIIEEQKLIVDESQRKVIASINYAKKIQYSILPSSEEISKFFPHHFVFFKPKDIVSGDFYWFHHENDLSFIAVADCTGHGVPGAFMTMIAHSILLEVVVEQKINEPAKILSNLHHLIFKNLQQQKGDEYSQDGMDISLAVIDHKNNLLHFSGARNNAFLVDNTEIKILKATQKSIGGLSLLGGIEPERSFKAETFQIKKDTLLILSSDGFFDQLNDEDEKFGNNRFKEMIVGLNPNNTEENLQTLENVFANWKKTAPQLDDVLCVGIKI